MSLRKYMHPRNKYKKVPDFKGLAILYPEFRKVAITDITGKVKIDFQNEESLKVLTEILLKHDFNLEVKIPPYKLVPTLPLRLNYVLWIEDLMKYAGYNEMDSIKGIDIGTGAVCIYPLLLAKMYGCHMIATEVDETSVQTAVQNVEDNNLQHLIKVVTIQDNTLLKGIVDNHEIYHFSMCNPPFFESTEVSEKVTKLLPPRNAATGNKQELTVQGGERKFVTKMIEEGMEIGSKIKIYTTMLGHKNNLYYLVKLMKKKDIANITWTEFCQGYTKRWGLAWSFLSKDNIDLSKAPVIRKDEAAYIGKLITDQRPTGITFPLEDKYSSLDDIVTLFKKWMVELNITVKKLDYHDKDFDGWACQLIAKNDMWSHARRKRRVAQRKMHEIQSTVECTHEAKSSSISDRNSNIESNIKDTDVQERTQVPAEKSDTNEPLLVCNFFIEIIDNEEIGEKSNVEITMIFEKGSGGKFALETFRQYLINQFNIREYFQKQHCKMNKKKRKRSKRTKKDPAKTNTTVQTASDDSSESS